MTSNATQAREQLLPLMRKSLDDPFDTDTFFEATSKWVTYINKVSANPDMFFAMEKEAAGDVEMSYLAYRFLSSSIGNTSTEDAIDKTQCFGFVFQIPSTKRYASVISVDLSTREKLAKLIKSHTRFPGNISFSRTAAAIPVGIQDFLPYDFLISMEKSMTREIPTPDFRISTLPSSASINVFLMAKFSLPTNFKNPNDEWEKVCQRIALQESKTPLEIVFKSLSGKKAQLTTFGYDIFPFCESVWGFPFQKIAQEIRILKSVPNTTPRVEFSTSEKITSFQPLLPATNVFAHIMNNGQDVASIHLAQTSCPAMAVGWTAYAIHTLVSPFCEIGSR